MEAMADPLVSPVFLRSFAGLVQRGMLVVWGEEELMAPDIERFVAVLEKSGGVAVTAHLEPAQPHVWPVLPCVPLIHRGADVIVPYIAGVLLQRQQ
jgi:acetyl esterase/lipase